MTFSRRRFLHAAGSVAVGAPFARPASAAAYPTQAIRLVVAAPPGGTLDITARLMGDWMSKRLGQPVVVENRPGGANNIGTEFVVRAAPDGYTLLLASAGNAVNATLYDNLNFNFIRDIEPIAGFTRVPLVMEVTPSIPAKTVPEFITYAKANPGKLNMASDGNGSPSQVGGELFKIMTGVSMAHIPYIGGGPALTALIGGQVQIMFSPIPASVSAIKSGQVRALAVTTSERAPAFPDLPTVADFVPGYEASSWNGLGAPKGVPAAAVDLLNETVNAGLADPTLKARLISLGAIPLPLSPAGFRTLIADETAKWAKVIKASGAKPD